MTCLTLLTLLALSLALVAEAEGRSPNTRDFEFSESVEVIRQRIHTPKRTVHDSGDELGELMKQAMSDWEEFKLRFNKNFDDEDMDNEHMLAFITAQQKIQQHNERFARGQVSFKLALNHLSDLPSAEYQRLNGFRMDSRRHESNASAFLAPMNVGAVPDAIDWRTQGYVTAVKDQGQCGSCWAFSAVGSLEGQHFRATGKLVSLSEQNLMDCSRKYGNNGCEGGLMDNAFQYVQDNKGIDTESSYPYEAEDEPSCNFQRSNVGATEAGHVDITSGDENALKIAVATQGPISVAIDASHMSFQQYKSGVYYEPQCSSTQLDHGVVVVGYGTDAKQGDYWIVKNSWSAQWGMQGYILMARNKNNNCGIATAASYPLNKARC